MSLAEQNELGDVVESAPVGAQGMDPVVRHKCLLALVDIFAMLAAFYLSYNLRNYLFAWRGGLYSATLNHLLLLLLLIPAVVLLFRHYKLYQPLGFKPTAEHLETMTRAWIGFFLFFVLLVFLLKIQLFIEHRISTVLFFFIGWGCLFLGRFIFTTRIAAQALRWSNAAPAPALFVGVDTAAMKRARDLVSDLPWKVEFAGVVCDDDTDEAALPLGLQRLGGMDELVEIIQRYRIREVFVTFRQDDFARLSRVLDRLHALKVSVRVAVHHFEVIKEKVPVLPELDRGFLALNRSPFVRLDRMLKRMLDLSLSLTALVLGLPLFLLIAILIKLESRGPVFFRQRRIGLDGQAFQVYKFRSMKANSEAFHQETIANLMQQDTEFFEKASGQSDRFKATEAAQVTRMGRFLRRTSLDELPQLINILKGEMSLVGPRPEPDYQVELYQDWQHARHRVHPGLTGIWQVYGRSAVPHEDMVLMDIFYIHNWSLSLDVKIIARTLFVVLTGMGAV